MKCTSEVLVETPSESIPFAAYCCADCCSGSQLSHTVSRKVSRSLKCTAIMLHLALLCPRQGALAANSPSHFVCRSIGNWMQIHPMQGIIALRRWSQGCTWERLRGGQSSGLRCVALPLPHLMLRHHVLEPTPSSLEAVPALSPCKQDIQASVRRLLLMSPACLQKLSADSTSTQDTLPVKITTPDGPVFPCIHVQEEAELFGPEVPLQLREPWALTTPALAKIDEDGSWLLSSTAQVLSETLRLPASLCTHTACMRVSTQCFSAHDLCPSCAQMRL